MGGGGGGGARRIKARGAGKSGVHFQHDSESLNKPAEFQVTFYPLMCLLVSRQLSRFLCSLHVGPTNDGPPWFFRGSPGAFTHKLSQIDIQVSGCKS